jgi:hypothetical protein
MRLRATHEPQDVVFSTTYNQGAVCDQTVLAATPSASGPVVVLPHEPDGHLGD